MVTFLGLTKMPAVASAQPTSLSSPGGKHNATEQGTKNYDSWLLHSHHALRGVTVSAHAQRPNDFRH